MAVRYKSIADGSNAAFKSEDSLNKILSPGCYAVEIEHNNSNVGLPVDCCSDEHYIVGTLLVTDSGTTGPKQHNRVTGQVLIFSLRPGNETKIFTRTHSAGAWGSWRTIAQIGLYDSIANADELYASVTALVAETKSIAANLSAEVARAQAAEVTATEQGRRQALRELFVAAGALYNDTSADLSRTAPWGETITHKAGHYYLNGLGDITEEQMVQIYNYKDAIKYLPKREGYRNSPVRTYFTPCEVSGQKEPQYTHSAFVNNSNLETVIWTTLNTEINTVSTNNMYNSQGAHSMFYGCKKLKVIYPMNVKSAATMEISNFNGCSSLVEVRLFNLMLNTGFKDSPDISKQSILYIVNNAIPANAITIILHPDAYARLANDPDIVAALEAKPLVSLVSA